VAEISADGSTLVYSTYLGGGYETAVSVGADANGEAFVTGITGSSGFPLMNPLFSAFGTTDCEYGYCAGFVSKIAAGGRNLLFSTLLPASPLAVTIDATGAAWLGVRQVCNCRWSNRSRPAQAEDS
jgi:hypothetical protein